MKAGEMKRKVLFQFKFQFNLLNLVCRQEGMPGLLPKTKVPTCWYAAEYLASTVS